MALKIKPADLETTIYRLGESDRVGDSNKPKGASDDMPHQESDVDKHFKQGFNPLSFSLKTGLDSTEALNFGPAAGAADIIYLPYYKNCITSTVIPTNNPSVCYFITDPMSGCNFFIDEWNNDLVCYHANAMQFSTPLAELKANAAAFNQEGVDKMNDLHREAQQAYPGSKNVVAVRVADYYRTAQASVEEIERQNCTDVEFYGGTIIMGFRVKGRWKFYFQTFSQIFYREEPTGFFKGKGKGKEGPRKFTPLKIIDTHCFWSA